MKRKSVKIADLMNTEQAAHHLGVSVQNHGTAALLTTKQLPAITGLSKFYFEKGRIYGFGPPFFKLGGRIFYRLRDVLAWMNARRVDPENRANPKDNADREGPADE